MGVLLVETLGHQNWFAESLLMRQLYPWLDPAMLAGKPTVGAMLDLCEENYRYLSRLIPGMRKRRPGGRACSRRGAELEVTILEQTPYTTTVRLTYLFEGGDEPLHADPDARIRLYHDARQVEVLDLSQQALPVTGGYQVPALSRKWRMNLFLSKWLGYCWRRGYCFDADAFGLLDERCV